MSKDIPYKIGMGKKLSDTMLGSDLDILIDDYNKGRNPRISEHQKMKWHNEVKRRGLTHLHFSSDHQKKMVLLSEDGFSGEVVCHMKMSAAKKIWEYGSDNHMFPRLKDLVRIGLFFHLDLTHISVLVLQGEWEYFFVKWWKDRWRKRDRARVQTASPLDILLDATIEERREANVDFAPDIGTLFELLRTYGVITTDSYDEGSYETLIESMIGQGLHWLMITDPALDKCAEDEARRLNDLRQGTNEQQEEFWIQRCIWNQKGMQLGEIAVLLENLRLNNAQVNHEWRRKFGEIELQLQEQICRFEIAGLRVQLKQIEPNLSPEKLELKVMEEKDKRDEKLDDLRTKVIIGGCFPSPEEIRGGAPVDSQKIAEDQKRIKRLLTKVRLMIHPDKLDLNPVYKKFTEREKEEVRSIMLEAMDVSLDELGIPKGFYGHDFRTEQGLLRVLDRLETIFENAGMEVNPDLVIKGDTIADQIAYLKREIAFVEKDIAACKSELAALSKDPEIQRKQDILNATDQHSRIIEDIERDTSAYRKKAEKLEKKLGLLFHEEAF